MLLGKGKRNHSNEWSAINQKTCSCFKVHAFELQWHRKNRLALETAIHDNDKFHGSKTTWLRVLVCPLELEDLVF